MAVALGLRWRGVAGTVAESILYRRFAGGLLDAAGRMLAWPGSGPGWCMVWVAMNDSYFQFAPAQ